MSNYALIKNNIVENIFVCDNDETTLVLFLDDVVVNIDNIHAGIGWSYLDSVFTAPPLPERPHDELVAEAEQQKSALLTVANNIIAPLQDAVDLGMATDDEQAQLLAWRKYRVLLNRVDKSAAPDVEWPTPPGQQAI